MKKDTFIETYSVIRLRNAVTQAKDAGAGHPAMALSYGKAGTGKTRAARALYADLGGVYLRVMEGMSQNAFLQEICFELGLDRPHGSARCKQALLGALRDDPRPIFVDEADRLHISRLEDLRDIHDSTGSPVILIGEMGLPTRLRARDRINDRIPNAFRVEFGEISQRDIMLFAFQAAGLTLSPEAASLLHTATKGNFRRVHNAVLSLEGAAKVAQTGEIDARLCRDALGIADKLEGGR